MSSSNSNFNRSEASMVPSVAPMSSSARALASLKEKKDAYTSGDWVGLGPLIGAAAVLALVVAIFSYYLITDSFSLTGGVGGAPGKYSELGWVSTASGLLLLFLVVVFATLVGGAIGLGFQAKGASLGAAVAAAILISIVFYWAFDAANADRAFQVMVWALIATIGGVLIAAWGWKSAKELAAENATNKEVESRAAYSMYMLVGAAVIGLILLYAFYTIYGAVPV